MKNEQIDFNSYVFRKYYQPKRKLNQREIDDKQYEVENDLKQDDVNNKTVNEVVNEKIVKQNINESEDDINKRIIDEINKEIAKANENEEQLKKNKQKVMTIKQVVEQSQKQDKNSKDNDKFLNNKSKTIQSKTDITPPNEKKEFIDDYQIIKLEKIKEKQKRIEYSKLLQQQIENQRKYKKETEINAIKQVRGNENQEKQSKLNLCSKSINQLIEQNLPSNYTITPCKTPKETQQFITTYANMLSDFCDIKMERYQNTQLLFKPYEKILNDMVDDKINQLTSKQSIQNEENTYQTNPIQIQSEIKSEKNYIEVNNQIEYWNINQIKKSSNEKGTTSKKVNKCNTKKFQLNTKNKGLVHQPAKEKNQNKNANYSLGGKHI